MQAFLQAIDDPAARASLNTAALPVGARQLIDMVDDPLIKDKAVDLGRKILKHRHDVAVGAATADDKFTQHVQSEGLLIKSQLDSKYPDAMSLLTNYASLQQSNMLAGGINAGTFAANAYVVANAGVYVNAAVATNVAVAAEAVALLAVVVS
ncbi:hypothetical protein [Xanthobacter versatilis]|uniref:hypothetical protein n=1 Tax=Xanthobacter autotrophicus (strain ATCC BAA-1158 / Py2) TaxID=78245 RepID=UPI003728D87A